MAVPASAAQARLHPPLVLLPAPSDPVQAHTCSTDSHGLQRKDAAPRRCVWRSLRTLPHHPRLQALLEAAGLAGFPPPLGDLAVVHHRAAVLNVA